MKISKQQQISNRKDIAHYMCVFLSKKLNVEKKNVKFYNVFTVILNCKNIATATEITLRKCCTEMIKITNCDATTKIMIVIIDDNRAIRTSVISLKNT